MNCRHAFRGELRPADKLSAARLARQMSWRDAGVLAKPFRLAERRALLAAAG